jgi:mannose-1-phosphate guanylyltransferase
MHEQTTTTERRASTESRWARHAQTAAGGTWAVVLAGGDGTRLLSLTTTAAGVAIPKQFCSLRGGASLLDGALRRAECVAPVERICAVVAEQHALWWSTSLAGLDPNNVFVQPQNRGTALGILLALVQICERDRNARVVILPADHHVADETVLARSLGQAVLAARARPANAVLLGVAPEEPDPALGYIVPAGDLRAGSAPVAWFVEKPDVAEAEALIARGALWNSFILAARADVSSTLADLYLRERAVDFSRDVAQRYAALFRVLRVPACGWTDLGTVQRVANALRSAPRRADRPERAGPGAWLSLEQQQAAARAAQGSKAEVA